MTIQALIDGYLADGFEVVQAGRVLVPAVPGQTCGECPVFSERVEGFQISMLGSYPPPTYRSRYDNRLLDDDERWVHLRRERTDD